MQLHATYTRVSRWGKSGVWQRVIEAVSKDRDLEALFINSTIVRAHQHAAGTQKKGSHALGRSRGELSTKIHTAVDALGNSLRWILTGGEIADITQAPALIKGFNAKVVVRDKGYDADTLVARLRRFGKFACKTTFTWTPILALYASVCRWPSHHAYISMSAASRLRWVGLDPLWRWPCLSPVACRSTL